MCLLFEPLQSHKNHRYVVSRVSVVERIQIEEPEGVVLHMDLSEMQIAVCQGADLVAVAVLEIGRRVHDPANGRGQLWTGLGQRFRERITPYVPDGPRS